MVIGVISDTHGRLRPEAVEALRGCALIVHAGDVGGPDILRDLQRLAPVHAVRGNVDTAAWAKELPETARVAAGPVTMFVVHQLADFDRDAAAGCGVVIYGHSHKPAAEHRDGVLFLNPGSAGPQRFRLPVTLARLHLEGDTIRHELVTLA